MWRRKQSADVKAAEYGIAARQSREMRWSLRPETASECDCTRQLPAVIESEPCDCCNSIAVMFELRCSKVKLDCSKSTGGAPCSDGGGISQSVAIIAT